MEEKVKLERMVLTFSQEGNCLGSTSEYEDLTIECDSSLGIDNDGDCFFVLKTNTGWSINDETELKELFNRIKKIIKPNE